MTIEVKGGEYNFQLGSYCWNLSESQSECLEIMVPLENRQRIVASVGEETSLTFKSAPAPDEKGVYYYVYSVEWLNKDKDKEKVSDGSVDYGFILDVK